MRKGVIFEPFLLLVLLISLSYAYYSFQFAVKGPELKIGELQGELIKVYNEGEKTLFLIDRVVLLSRDKSIKELKENAGLVNEKCKEKVNDEALGVYDENECKIEDIEKNYFNYLSKNLNRYLKELKIKEDNHNFEIDEEKKILIGKSKDPLMFSIHRGGFKTGNYIVKPDFKVDFEDDLSIYTNLYEKSLDVIKNCVGDLACANDKFNEFNAEISTANINNNDFFMVKANDINFLIKLRKRI